MHRTFRTYLVATLAFVAAGVTASPRSHAEPPASPARIMAHHLYDQALKDMDRNDFAAACSKLEEVVRLVPEGVGAKLTLAGCYEADTRLASAWSTYLLAEAAAVRTEQADRQQLARKLADALKPQLARLQIAVPNIARDLPGLVITCDDVPIAHAHWDDPIFVDRGPHVIAARASGRLPWKAVVHVARDGVTAHVKVGPMFEATAAKPPVDNPSVPPPAPQPVADASTASGGQFTMPWGPQRTIGKVAVSIGAVGVAVGFVAGGMAMGYLDASSVNGHCRDTQCNGAGFRTAVRNAGSVAAATLIASAFPLTLGLTLLSTAPKPKSPRAQITAGLERIDLRMTW